MDAATDFTARAEPHRGELLAYEYRMVGSVAPTTDDNHRVLAVLTWLRAQQ